MSFRIDSKRNLQQWVSNLSWACIQNNSSNFHYCFSYEFKNLGKFYKVFNSSLTISFWNPVDHSMKSFIIYSKFFHWILLPFLLDLNPVVSRHLYSSKVKKLSKTSPTIEAGSCTRRMLHVKCYVSITPSLPTLPPT